MVWLKSFNLYAMAALVVLGAVVVVGSIRVGVKLERGKNAAETAAVNTVIVEDRGKDEAEIPIQDAEAARIDAAVKAALKQRFILDEETATQLARVK